MLDRVTRRPSPSFRLLCLPLLALSCQPQTAHSPSALPEQSPPKERDATPSSFLFSAGGVHTRVSTQGEGTFRLDWSKDATFPGPPSFAVLDSRIPSEVRPASGEAQAKAPRATLHVSQGGRELRFLDDDQKSPLEALDPVTFEGKKARFSLPLRPGDRVFGLGDKTRGTNRRGHSYELWNTDAYGYGKDTDPLYKSIPFVIVVSEERAYGVFIDSAARGTVDVGKARPDQLSFEFEESATLTAYIFQGKSPSSILDSYTKLTGRLPLPPLWALGFHQSRYGYLTEGEVRGVVDRFSEERLPLDAIWLDIDFQEGNAPFTVNEKAFPTFNEMIAGFAKKHVKTVVITDPHIKSYQGKEGASGYHPYDSGARGDHFIRSGSQYFEGPVWPGVSVFPEFTLSRTREWWGTLYQDFASRGLHGFWNDMNEPALFVDDKTMPSDLTHRLDDGTSLSHTAVHNNYGFLNARSTYEGLLSLRPTERPFILTRAAAAGVQRYAASWTGDNTASVEHLALTISQLNNLGVSGYSFVGADVGGFIGCPSKELLAAWMQLGVYQPFFRNHSQKESCRREPWVHDKATLDRTREALERRYELLPYLYTAFEESAQTGAPIVRPLWYDYPSDTGSLDEESSFLLGRDLLLVPRFKEDELFVDAYFPPGKWHDRQTGKVINGGTKTRIVFEPGDSVQEFARAGSVIPETSALSSSEDLKDAPLLLHVFPETSCYGSVYSDDGKSFEYATDGKWQKLQVSCSKQADGYRIRALSLGKGAGFWSKIVVLIHGQDKFNAARLNGKPEPVTAQESGTQVVEVPGKASAFDLVLSR